MKLGTKSHLISAYSALFTVALGVIAWDLARRSSSAEKPALAQPSQPPAPSALAMR